MIVALAFQFHVYLPWGQRNVKAVVATFNQVKALVGAFSVIVKTFYSTNTTDCAVCDLWLQTPGC